MNQLPFKEVEIDGFRGLRKLKLNEMGAINILVGGNNSGKTSILEALSIACNPFEPFEWLNMIRRRDFGGLDETRIQSLRWCFRQQGELTDPDYMFEGTCRLRTNGAFSLRSLEAQYKDMIGVPGNRILKQQDQTNLEYDEEVDLNELRKGAEITHLVEAAPSFEQGGMVQGSLFDESAFDESTYSEKESITRQFWEEDRTVGRVGRSKKRGNLPTETLAPYSYQLNKLQVRSHSSQLFDSSVKKESVLELAQQFDSKIIDIEVASLRGNRPALYVNHKEMGPAPLSVFGDALRRAVLLSSTLHILKGGILLIDEIEAGIHTSGLESLFCWLMKAARNFNVQVVATTHSLEALDGMIKAAGDDVDDLVTFHINNEDECTDAKRISGELLHRLRYERGLDVR